MGGPAFAAGVLLEGHAKKILISAALLHNPELLIRDEPYSGLDVNTAMVAHDSVARLRERMEESSLEGVFAQLTQPENTDAVARQILDVVAE